MPATTTTDIKAVKTPASLQLKKCLLTDGRALNLKPEECYK
jgi:hypothetical protein